MILILMSFLFTCLTIFASETRVMDVQVGGSLVIPVPTSVLKTPRYNFFFSSDNYNFRLVNKLIAKEVVVAILPPEYALKAVWTSNALDIVGKTSKHYVYLVSREKNKKITKENIKNKKILLLENSADEFYLKKYLGKIQYQRIPGTAIDLANSVSKNDGSDYILMDSMSYFLLKKEALGISALKIESGVYYIVTLQRDNEIMFSPATRDLFKKNNMSYDDLTKEDLVELKILNNSMFKKRLGQEYFEELLFGLMQR